jgi:hypothetical protein
MSATSAQSNHTVHEFVKNGREVVRTSLGEYRGSEVIDLRVFYMNSAGTSSPTPKGLTLSRSLLPRLEEAVAALRSQVDAEATTGHAA